MWKYTGAQRPPFAIEPGPHQESVWDYPRPPAIRPTDKTIVVLAGEHTIARTAGAIRICETASPPTFYLPPDAVSPGSLLATTGSSFCEWKGTARYFALANDSAAAPVAWSYADPAPAFAAIRDWLCFYPDRVQCFVDGERVRAQTSSFYGGWVTDDIVGPWKGEPGTAGW